MNTQLREVREAVEAWSQADPSTWNTGLSAAGARLAMKTAAKLVLDGELGVPRGQPPKTVVIWCASNVFTAPLEWTAQFAALGAEVRLKAPSASPLSTQAMAEAFRTLNVHAHHLDHTAALGLLEGADALLAFGSDETLADLDTQIPADLKRSFHGHRASIAVVSGQNPIRTAEALAWDLVLYDGRGCMSPSAIFCLDHAEELAEALGSALAQAGDTIPPGPLEPWQGPQWRSRTGRARVLGRCLEGKQWAVCTTNRSSLEPNLPRMAVLHELDDLQSLSFLSDVPLSTCATDLEHTQELEALGFHRICSPGDMQRPPLNRRHDGVDVIATLSSSQ
ncbi:MAG: acyl-CoA reductase [Myxococcota bacterium]|nr:acyl-CoA reductase [Myxococcota bacterium]